MDLRRVVKGQFGAMCLMISRLKLRRSPGVSGKRPGYSCLDDTHIFRCLSASILLCFCTPFSLPAQTIHAVQENGRTIFVNDDSSPAPTRDSRRDAKVTVRSEPASTLVYWSTTEKRWKPVPGPSPNIMRRARVAAAEVQRYVAARPRTPAAVNAALVVSPETTKPAARVANPNYDRLAEGRVVTTAEIDRIIEDAATRHHVDPNLVRALIKAESNFNPNAVSRKGAMGLMQLMPDTARRFNVTNPFSPKQNVEAGVQHLKRLLDNFGGNVQLTLAAYNAGVGAVNRNNGVPPYRETQNYVRKISGYYNGGGTMLFSSPIRVARNSSGVITISNVE